MAKKKRKDRRWVGELTEDDASLRKKSLKTMSLFFVKSKNVPSATN